MKNVGRIAGLILLLVSISFSQTYKDSFSLSCAFLGNPPVSHNISVSIQTTWDSVPSAYVDIHKVEDTVITGEYIAEPVSKMIYVTTPRMNSINLDSIKVRVTPMCVGYSFQAVVYSINHWDTSQYYDSMNVLTSNGRYVADFYCQPVTEVKSMVQPSVVKQGTTMIPRNLTLTGRLLPARLGKTAQQIIVRQGYKPSMLNQIR